MLQLFSCVLGQNCSFCDFLQLCNGVTGFLKSIFLILSCPGAFYFGICLNIRENLFGVTEFVRSADCV